MDYDIIEKIKEKIVSNINPKAIILFGSVAKNQDTDESDIDLLVVWDDEQELSKAKKELN